MKKDLKEKARFNGLIKWVESAINPSDKRKKCSYIICSFVTTNNIEYREMYFGAEFEDVDNMLNVVPSFILRNK